MMIFEEMKNKATALIEGCYGTAALDDRRHRRKAKNKPIPSLST
jgi:hypothetical protein